MTKEMINKMIFDLQRFVDPEIYLATSSNETVSITKAGNIIGATRQKQGTSQVVDLRAKTDGATVSGVNAGSGNDTIEVGAGVDNISILGGKGNDKISIDESSCTGNKYVYNNADGKDSVYGWRSDKDVLIVDDIGSVTTAMSADGNELLVKYGNSGWVAF